MPEPRETGPRTGGEIRAGSGGEVHSGAAASGRTATGSGPGRLLVAVYAIFALAAGARAGVQIGTKFSDAPVAYALSAFAAVVYVLATIALARGGRTSRRVAVAACSVELAGVLIVGTLSLIDEAAFPDATVWSGYGEGYGFVPLVLPVVGLLWLRRVARTDGGARTGDGATAGEG